MSEVRRKHSSKRSKYAKIPIKIKVKFLRKVLFDGFSIRDSSMIFDINYSTAKTLIRQYRADTLGFDLSVSSDETNPNPSNSGTLRCSYRFIENGDTNEERTSIANHLFYLKTNQNECVFNNQTNNLKLHSNVTYSRIEVVSSIANF